MRTPAVNYRQLRLYNIRSPEYSHLLLLLGWVGYFILFFLTENLIPAEKCFSVRCPLDDVIPFNEYFFIPYTFWYVLIVASLLYFLLYSVDSFKKLQTYLIITQVVAIITYILFPTRQDLRPTEFPRENFWTGVARLIYTLDTNTGVCPSLHVAFSIGIASTWLRDKSAQWPIKAFVAVAAFFICISVAFVKQHSVMDIFAAIPVCFLAEWLVFFRRRKQPK